MAKAAGVTVGQAQDLLVTIELDVRTRNKGNLSDIDRLKFALLNLDQNLVDVNGVRITDVSLQANDS